MVLSEDYIKRLQNIAGINVLSEVDNRRTITGKINLPKSIADWAHELSDKYSIWIANTFKDEFINTAPIFANMQQDVKDEIVTQINSGKISHQIEAKMKSMSALRSNDYRHILDWVRGRGNLPVIETEKLDFKTLTYDEAKSRSTNWHDELARLKGGTIEDEQGEVVMTFPDGFYWINLGKKFCEEEAEAMGHCGRGNGVLYSLRRAKYPYVTVDLHDGIVEQIKGRANTKPKKDYHNYIIEFLLDNNIDVSHLHSSYQPQTDFNLNDLTDKQLLDVVKKKPGLLKYSESAIKRIVLLAPDVLDFILKDEPKTFEGMNQSGMWNKEQIDYILENEPSILMGQGGVLTSLNTEQIDYILKNSPKLFEEIQWGLVENWSTEHTGHMLSNHSEYFDNQVIYELIKSKKISELQINWIVENNPSIMLKQNPLLLLSLTKEQLKKIAKEHPEFFTVLLKTEPDEKLMGASKIDSEIISILTHDSEKRSNLGLYKYFSFLPKNKITAEHLAHIVKIHPDIFVAENMGRFFALPSVVQEAPKVIQYILDENPDIMSSSIFLKMEDWPFTEKQKDFLISQEDNVLDRQDLSKMKFSKKQMSKLIKERPSIFDPDTQDFDKLGITAKGIEYIIANSKGTIPDKKVEEMLSTKELSSLFEKNPKWTSSVYLQAKHNGYEGVKSLKKTLDGGFEKDYVEILYEDWQDESLADLFDEKDAIRRIANYELDFYGYDQSYGDASYSFDDLDSENTAYVKYLLKKAMTESSTLKEKKSIEGKIQSMSTSQLYSLIGDPDDFTEENEIEHHNEEILEGLKTATIRALEDSQRTADEDEYWKLYTKPVIDFFGEPEWVEKKIKKFDKKTKKEKTETRSLLKFKMPYDKFLELLRIYEEHNSSDDEYSVDIEDGALYPIEIIRIALTEEDEELKFEEPHYGVQGNIEEEAFNEMFSERMNEELGDELENAKVVVKK